MNKDKIYFQWMDQRRQVPVPDGFADRVMAEIKHQRPVERVSLFDGLGVRAHFAARWAAALGLIALGIYRIVFVTANLLMGSTL